MNLWRTTSDDRIQALLDAGIWPPIPHLYAALDQLTAPPARVELFWRGGGAHFRGVPQLGFSVGPERGWSAINVLLPAANLQSSGRTGCVRFPGRLPRSWPQGQVLCMGLPVPLLLPGPASVPP